MTRDIDIEFGPVKDAKNLAKHGVSLAVAQEFDWDTVPIEEDLRQTYPEPRFRAFGYIEERMHVAVFCMRKGNVRVISVRKANPNEVKKYANSN